MLVILVGKTASGKDSVVKELVNNGWNKVVTYTTRPMRKGEINGLTYHYISNEEFEHKIKEDFFLEYKSYTVANGSTWYYGSVLNNDYTSSNYVIILTPQGYKDFLKTKIPHLAFYIYANNKTIRKRLKKRGDSKDEAERRLKQDNVDFKDVHTLVDKIIYNNLENTIEEVVNKIEMYIKELPLD